MYQKYKDVHTEHCCKWHGCKYAYDELEEKECTVIQGAPQSYPCEYCSMDWETYSESKKINPEWIVYMKTWKNIGRNI